MGGASISGTLIYGSFTRTVLAMTRALKTFRRSSDRNGRARPRPQKESRAGHGFSLYGVFRASKPGLLEGDVTDGRQSRAQNGRRASAFRQTSDSSLKAMLYQSGRRRET